MQRLPGAGGASIGPLLTIGIAAFGVVYEAYDRSADGVDTFLTLASNGVDALRSVGIALNAHCDTEWIRPRNDEARAK